MTRMKTMLAVVFAIFIPACLMLFFLPRDWTEYGDPGSSQILSITVVRNYDALHVAAFLLALGLFATACVSIKIKTIPFRVMLWIFPLLLYPASCIKNVVSNPAPWTYHGTIKDGSGRTYYFLDSSFLQGQMMAIGCLMERTVFLDRFEVLAATNGDSPRQYLYIVRPEGSQDRYGQLYLTRDNWLAGLRSENRMFLACDLNAKKSYVRDEVRTLSPFLLVDKKTRLLDSDRERLLKIGIGSGAGQPDKNRILEASRHDNPEVRSLVKSLLSLKK